MKNQCLRRQEGFTLIELILVMTILVILFGLGSASYFGQRNKKALEGQAQRIVAELRQTMEKSKSQTDGSQWGMHFENPVGADNDFYQVWRGASYASGTIISRFPLEKTISYTNPASGSSKDVIFAKATGLPTASSTIGLQTASGGNTATITIDSSGRIDYVTN